MMGKTHLTSNHMFKNYLGKNTKGSQIFRKILKYDTSNNLTYDTDRWCKKLKTSEICPGEIRNAYKAYETNTSQDNYWTSKPKLS